MKRLISSRLQQELSGYATSILLVGFIVGTLVLTSSVGLTGTAQNALSAMAIILILLTSFMVRLTIVNQPKKNDAHVAQVYENEKAAWEMHGFIKNIVPISETEPEYREAMKPLVLEGHHAYMVNYDHVTFFGDNPHDFKSALLYTPVPIEELYAPISHETLTKGFPTEVGCGFMVMKTLHWVKQERVKGLTDEFWMPVFLVRMSHYHFRPEQILRKAAQINIEALDSGGLASRVLTVNLKEKMLEGEEKARDEGIRIGRMEGEALIEDYVEANKTNTSLPNMRAHPKMLGVFLMIGITIFIASYLMGWLRWIG